ncbi:protein of unknown function [Agrobacterium pusense]|uniref:Uncharacterized protein n=1 Tax=Agrobacterium pusense TaxID=648995 RepID=U4Q9S8_9HYPH|nr:protein of unknown function [Agrobacterium pusense]
MWRFALWMNEETGPDGTRNPFQPPLCETIFIDRRTAIARRFIDLPASPAMDQPAFWIVA